MQVVPILMLFIAGFAVFILFTQGGEEEGGGITIRVKKLLKLVFTSFLSNLDGKSKSLTINIGCMERWH